MPNALELFVQLFYRGFAYACSWICMFLFKGAAALATASALYCYIHCTGIGSV